MTEFRYIARFKEYTDGVCSVYFPDLECATEGHDKDHAKLLAADLLEIWLEIFIEEGRRLPIPRSRKELEADTSLYQHIDEEDYEESTTDFIEITVRLPVTSKDSSG